MSDDHADALALETGRRLKACRDLLRWSQRQLAENTGWRQGLPDRQQTAVLSPSRIGNFEQGTRRIRHEEAKLLEMVFQVPSGFFTGDLSTQEATVVAALRGLTGRVRLEDTAPHAVLEAS